MNRVGEPPGTRCEIKNLNSVKFMMVAISRLLSLEPYALRYLTANWLFPLLLWT